VPRPRGCGCCRACPCDGSLVSQPVSFLPRADLPFLRESGRWCRLSWLLWGSQGTAITPLRQWVWAAPLATLDLSVFASSLGMNV
uniref:Uncharacterized protein n=1 Tax=Papio anubis TaxID=9555 RepID=A0A8I5R947_PAPAN